MKLLNLDGTPTSFPAHDAQNYFDTPNGEECVETLRALLGNPEVNNKGAVLKVYLENFKFFNDTFSYEYGEGLLREIARFFCTLPGADVYRYMGVDFILVLEDASYAEMIASAEAIISRFERTWHIDSVDCMCIMNLGAVMYPDFARSAEEALENLEHAVHNSSTLGQNQLAVYDSGLSALLTRRKSIAHSISEAVSSDGILIGYRPTYSVRDGKYTRAECYLQLASHGYGLVREAEFWPIAEQSGQICAINMLVICKTCQFIRELLDKGLSFESIAVRLSPVQLLQEFFPEAVGKILWEYKIPEGKLAFEISESLLLTSFSRVNAVMQKLAGLGVELILNEFGSGYSGITNILDLPVQVVKLERLFVWQMETNPRSKHLIQGLCTMAEGLGIKLIAEGVETENQVGLLDEFGCNYRQGFYYSSVVDQKSLQELLNQ